MDTHFFLPLQTTPLVNEVYLRLIGAHKVEWQERVHFFAIAARLMRPSLVDFARTREETLDTHFFLPLQTTPLVNEVYLRLIGAHKVEWQERVHFFAIAARLMRPILVDFARTRGCQKRGGDVRKVTLDEALEVPLGPDQDLATLDDALMALAECDARKARVVELRHFGGLSVDGT